MNSQTQEIEEKNKKIAELQQEIEKFKQQDRALLESDVTFKFQKEISDGLIENLPDGIVGINENGEIIIFNKKAEKIFGYSKEEIVGQKLDTLLPNRSIEGHSVKISNYFRNPNNRVMGSTNTEFYGKAKDGRVFPILVGLSYYKSEVGAIAISSIIDITDLQAARDEVSKLSLAIEQSPVSVVITDLNGNIEYVNPKFTDLTGYSIREVLGQNPRVLKSGEKTQEEYQKLWGNITRGESWRGEFHNRKKNGEYYWESATISAVKNIHDEIINFIAVKEDITDKKRVEEEVKSLMKELISKNNEIEETNSKLEATLKEKDKFFSIIAHDLKSPFSGFLGLSEVLSNSSYDWSVEEMREYSKLLLSSAESLYKLLENLLEWATMQRGLVSFNPENINLYQIIESNFNIISSRAQLKEIFLINKCDDEIEVLSDASMLNGVCRNLISNSIKFTKRGGKVTIDAVINDNTIQISISDTGIGMSKEMIPKLFAVGEKTSRPGTEDESSTGLGLLLCKDYVIKNNGKIWVESEEGKGTTFYFTLPKGQ